MKGRRTRRTERTRGGGGEDWALLYLGSPSYSQNVEQVKFHCCWCADQDEREGMAQKNAENLEIATLPPLLLPPLSNFEGQDFNRINCRYARNVGVERARGARGFHILKEIEKRD